MHRHLKRVSAWLSALCATLVAGCASHEGLPADARSRPLPEPFSVEVTRNVIYTPQTWPQALTADIYTPAGSGPFPGVLVVHGGGWTGRSRADMDSISQRLAERGYVAMNISYRFAPRWHFPSQLQDLQQALRWLRANAGEQKVVTDQIAVWGYSAGAHLASLLAVTGPGDRHFLEGTRVQALVAGGTPTDLRNYPDGPLTNALLGTPLKTNPELWRDASPVALVTPDDPPTFLYHGTFDYTVQLRNSRNMYAALQAAKIPAELYLLRGREHIITFLLDSPVTEGIEFLDRHLRPASSTATAASQ